MEKSPINTFIYYFVQFTWGIIQNVIGLLLWIIIFIKNSYRNKTMFNQCFVCEWKLKGSLSLGIFIFLSNNSKKLLVHEYGHSIQSLILGPLYLLIIGLPSFIWAVFLVKLRSRKKYNYYNFYTEKWANKLAYKITGIKPVER